MSGDKVPQDVLINVRDRIERAKLEKEKYAKAAVSPLSYKLVEEMHVPTCKNHINLFLVQLEPDQVRRIFAGRKETVIVQVSRALAHELLPFNTDNRKWKEENIKSFFTQIISGQFRHTHQGIAFRYDGTLNDGQNRLLALSRLPEGHPGVFLNVTFNETKEDQLATDQRPARTICDGARLMGVDLNGFGASIAKYGIIGDVVHSKEKPTVEGVLDFISKHEDPFQFIVDDCMHGIGKKPTAAAMFAVFLAATDTRYPRERIKEFVTVLSTFRSGGPHDNAAISLCNTLERFKKKKTDVLRQEVFAKTECALWHFLRYQDLLKIMPSSKRWFALYGPDNPVPTEPLKNYHPDPEVMKTSKYWRKDGAVKE